MKHFNRSAITAALIITLAAAFTVNAKSAEMSDIENSISEMVVAQGQQVISDLTVQLQQTITEEINSFSINFSFEESVTESLAWFTEKTSKVEDQEVKQAIKVEVN